MQNKPDENKLIIIEKNKFRKKLVLIVLLIVVLLLLFTIVIVFAVSLDNARDEVVTPTASPTLQFSPTPKTTNTPTSIVGPSISNTAAQRYIFPDCEIELHADSLWIPSERGYLGTCGILSTSDLNEFTDLNNYEGTLIAILPFLNESVFAPEKQKSYTEYLDKIIKDQNRYNPTKDFLYAEKETLLATRPAVETEIYKAGLGMTHQIFFKGLQREYIILWGGNTSQTLEPEVADIINTIKLIQTLPEEE